MAILLTPVFAQANTFSFVALLLGQTVQASGVTTSPHLNSQDMPLLAAAVNLDPRPAVGGGNILVVGGSALVPQEGPSGTVADVQEQPVDSQISIYVVRPGDTISQIAAMFKVSVNTIIWANNLQSGTVHPGDSLIILPITGIEHVVVAGDTLESLAKNYKSDLSEIAKYNNLADNASLTAGQTILIPNGEQPGPTSSSSQSGGVKSSGKQTWKQLAKAGKQTSKLHDANGPDQGNYFAWPVEGGVITQGLHGFDAVDIGAPKGANILAAAGGVVIVAKVGGWNGGYGSYVVVAHGNGTQTLYAHASKILVSSGDQVTQGQTIAEVGQTGEATGPHLHFEVRGAKNPFGDLAVGDSVQ